MVGSMHSRVTMSDGALPYVGPDCLRYVAYFVVQDADNAGSGCVLCEPCKAAWRECRTRHRRGGSSFSLCSLRAFQSPRCNALPEAKRSHLREFWLQVMGGRPMTLVGASLGGAIAIDFAHEFPEAVKRLVLIDAQGFIDGSGPGASLPGPLARLGVQVLGSKVRSLWLPL